MEQCEVAFVSDKQTEMYLMYLIQWTRSRIFSITGRELHYKSQNFRGVLALIWPLQWLHPEPRCFLTDVMLTVMLLSLANYIHVTTACSIQHVVLVSVWKFKEILKERCENVIIQRAVVARYIQNDLNCKNPNITHTAYLCVPQDFENNEGCFCRQF